MKTIHNDPAYARLLESSARIYDGMAEAVETWPEEMRDQILVYVLSLYAVCLKAAERDPSKGHPLIKHISGGLEKYGIKLK